MRSKAPLAMMEQLVMVLVLIYYNLHQTIQ